MRGSPRPDPLWHRRSFWRGVGIGYLLGMAVLPLAALLQAMGLF